MMGLVRLLTNESVMGGSRVNLAEALALYDRWRRDPRVEMALEPSTAEALLRRALVRFHRLPATKALADCYLVAFAEAVGARVVTFDKGLAGTARIRAVSCVLIG